MHSFQVNDLTCGHCVATVEKAVKGVDADAIVKIDLATHKVDIESRKPVSQFAQAIESAGYTGNWWVSGDTRGALMPLALGT
ncbi:heavy-metal-associated domain-containing protein [Devosia sp.]|uniref:heavy-metal-associated domain-containing protein n=1 Tax=Devosia sp. TaxID=1871048 RepID=UPI003263775C